eukprot:scaffold9085_cov215-Amphora_coffeaeformis.AAC.8
MCSQSINTSSYYSTCLRQPHRRCLRWWIVVTLCCWLGWLPPTRTQSVPEVINNTQNTLTLPPDTCPPCPQCRPETEGGGGGGGGDDNEDEDEQPLVLQILVVDSIGIINMVEWNARDYEAHVGGRVKIVIQRAPTMPALFAEVENDARTGASLFDAYFTNPTILGTAAIGGGFADLTAYVKQQSQVADWTDVLLGLRTHVTSFEDKIYIILLDGDTHTLFYRRDVLEHFGLNVPRTWEEYTQVAKAVHGQVFEGQELYGSCVSRKAGDHAMYWAHLLLSSMAQTQGTATGSLFDTADMTPLTTGPVVAEMLRWHELHNAYGAPDGAYDIGIRIDVFFLFF